MFPSGGTRLHPRGSVLLGVASGLVAIAAGFVVAYFVLGPDSTAHAAATAEPPHAVEPRRSPPPDLSGYLARQVELVTAHGSVARTWSELGAAVDTDEAGASRGDLAALAAKGSLPL